MRGLTLVLIVVCASIFVASAAAAPGASQAYSAGSVAPLVYKNCTNLNKRYPHGVGKKLAKDKTSGVPVRDFKRSTPLYLEAMSHNRGLDRDKDGIACEKL
jgi:Excalibur calcium-binding domain